MFQIFKKLGVKLYDLSLRTERLQRNLNYVAVNLPIEFFEIFNIFRTTVFFLSYEFKKIFEKSLKTIVTSKPVDEGSNNFQRNKTNKILAKVSFKSFSLKK